MSVSLDFGLLTLSYSDNLPYAFCEQIGKEIRDISDEIPFEIPESWEWCRLSFANDMYTGNSINESEKKAKYTGLSEGRYYIGTKDVEFNHTIVYDNGVKIPFDAVKFRIAPCSSILMCIEGGSAGRKIAFTDYEVCFGNKLCCFVSWGLDYMFLYYYLQSPIFQSAFNEAEKYWLCSGDILIQRSNSRELVGTSCIYYGDEKCYIYPDLMMRIHTFDKISV